jgi:CHAD domain-containing protein
MPYALGSQESVPEALRRSAREQLEAAISELADGSPADPVEAIHDARKALKKERSLLRLGAAAFDSAQRRAENRIFRDAAQQLGGTRDADVMIQAIDDLADRYAGQLPHGSFTALRERLVARRDAGRRQLSDRHAIESVADSLRAASLRVVDWRLRREGWAVIGSGLLQGYGRGSQAFERARRRPTVENLHEWRKGVKDLWYHLRWLGPIAPQMMDAHAQDAHHLSELLGDDHDLAVLRESVLAIDGEPALDREPLVGLIDHRRDQLQTEAMFLGRRVYAEAPKAFTSRLHRYWKAWRSQARAEDAHPPSELAEATTSGPTPSNLA